MPGDGDGQPPSPARSYAPWIAAAGFIAIVLGAIAVRFWALDSQPGGLYPDEAAEGVSAQRMLTEPGYHPVFIDDDGGREALYAYAVALSFRLFGSSVLVLRSTAAAVGVLGVVAIWLAVRRFGRGAALAAAAWAAGSLWLICVSRDGFRNIITVAVGALALAAILRWGDRPSRGWAIATGVAVGAGLWTYQPLKLTPLLVIAWLAWMRHSDAERYRAVRGHAGWAIAAYLVVAGPMIATAVTDFNNYFGRAAGVSVFNAASGSTDSYPVHVLKTIGMFLVTGDPNQRHDVDALPLLGPVLFIPFALGIWRAWRMRNDHAHAALLLGVLVFLLPPLVANEGGAPHFLRSLGLAPFVAALVGLGCFEAVRLAQLGAMRLRPAFAGIALPAAAAACGAGLAVLGVLSIHTYLVRPASERYDAYSFADVQLAAAASGGPGTAVVVGDFDAFDVRFLDAADPPATIEPGRHLAHPEVYSLIVAPTRGDIATATSAATAARALVVARDPSGNPVVWEVSP
jgi:4-amino-4-deoxy-L-arabinose transferase-like glycosyltransferase